jgi:hypothetical protein
LIFLDFYGLIYFMNYESGAESERFSVLSQKAFSALQLIADGGSKLVQGAANDTFEFQESAAQEARAVALHKSALEEAQRHETLGSPTAHIYRKLEQTHADWALEAMVQTEELADPTGVRDHVLAYGRRFDEEVPARRHLVSRSLAGGIIGLGLVEASLATLNAHTAAEELPKASINEALAYGPGGFMLGTVIGLVAATNSLERRRNNLMRRRARQEIQTAVVSSIDLD